MAMKRKYLRSSFKNALEKHFFVYALGACGISKRNIIQSNFLPKFVEQAKMPLRAHQSK